VQGVYTKHAGLGWGEQVCEIGCLLAHRV